MKPLPLERIAKIKGVIFDVDGILTDCRIWYGEDGTWRRAFNMRDGLGIKSVVRAGYKVGFITGSRAPDIRARAQMLEVPFLSEGQDSKEAAFAEFLKKYELRPAEVACLGDDSPDLPLLRSAGLAVTVPEAIDEVKEIAHFITDKAGGHGAARQFCDLLLRHGGLRAR